MKPHNISIGVRPEGYTCFESRSKAEFHKLEIDEPIESTTSEFPKSNYEY